VLYFVAIRYFEKREIRQRCCRDFEVDSRTLKLTSPLVQEGVDVHESEEEVVGLVEPRLLAVEADHQGTLKHAGGYFTTRVQR
jgi:hypothetical protein